MCLSSLRKTAMARQVGGVEQGRENVSWKSDRLRPLTEQLAARHCRELIDAAHMRRRKRNHRQMVALLAKQRLRAPSTNFVVLPPRRSLIPQVLFSLFDPLLPLGSRR